MLNPVARILESFFKKDKLAITGWLRAPNIKFEGKTPNEMIENGNFYKVWQFCIIHMKDRQYELPNIPKKN